MHWLDMSASGCEAGAMWRFNSEGMGKLSHLGKVHWYLTHCTYFDPAQGIVFRDGTITFTAPNGDRLIVAQVGTSGVVGDMAGFTVDGTWSAVGGTGRFMRATGSGALSGGGDIPGREALFGLTDGEMMLDFDGEVAYAASDRSK